MATLIHELAHVNGAPGFNTQAEDALLDCLLKKPHQPGVIGRIYKINPHSGSETA